jgi:hypothetical protein
MCVYVYEGELKIVEVTYIHYIKKQLLEESYLRSS